MGLSFDTGALIALVEGRRLSMRKVYSAAKQRGDELHVSTAVIVEWWREGPGESRRSDWLRTMHVEVLDHDIARLAGIAVGRVKGAGAIDAIVMATAALRRDSVVYTSDPDDLIALRDGVAEFADLKIAPA